MWWNIFDEQLLWWKKIEMIYFVWWTNFGDTFTSSDEQNLVTKQKKNLWQNSPTQIVLILNDSNFAQTQSTNDQTKKINLWQN